MGNYQGNKLTHNSSQIAHPQLPQLNKPLWTDYSLKSGNDVHKPIYIVKKKKKKKGAGREFIETLHKILTCKDITTNITTTVYKPDLFPQKKIDN